MEEKELSLDELDNVLPGKAGIEKALEHPELYRKKMIDELIKERQLPPLKRREEMIEVLCREEYGIMPELKAELSVSDKLFSRNIL